jgi:CheY-like chemotaxis protein
MRILIAEDDAPSRTMLATVLAHEGHTVAAAANGLAALDLAAAWPPDLILVDMKMPVMDGQEFVRRYRELPPPHAPIVVLTATDAAQQAVEIDAAGFLSKPFDVGKLVELVERYAA